MVKDLSIVNLIKKLYLSFIFFSSCYSIRDFSLKKKMDYATS